MIHNIYLLTIREETALPQYDFIFAQMVISDNEIEARKLCNCSDECSRNHDENIWLNPLYTLCTKIGESDMPKGNVIMATKDG